MNGFSKGILLLNTGSGPAFIIEQAFKLNMDRDLMRTGVLIGLCLYRPFRGASPLPQGFLAFTAFVFNPDPLWERACSRLDFKPNRVVGLQQISSLELAYNQYRRALRLVLSPLCMFNLNVHSS